MNPRAEWALAALPVLLSGLLIRHAASDDSYFDDGRSYWETHSSGRVVLVIAVLINLAAVATILRARRLWPGIFLTVLGLLASFVAWVAITAN